MVQPLSRTRIAGGLLFLPLRGRNGLKSLNQKGHTAGSRVSFIHPVSKSIFYMHRPHPENTIGKKTIDELVRFLKEEEIV